MMSCRLMLVLALLALALPAQERFAVVSHNNVSVMAGPQKPDAELMKVMAGQVVRYLGESGEFGEVIMPGGVIGHVAKGRGGRQYVSLDAPGEARVLVNKLQLRPQPNVDWPAMGSVSANDRLLVLGEVEGGWLRVLAPRDQKVYVHRDYLDLTGDQTVLASTYANSDRLRRERLLASGEFSGAALERIKQVEAVDSRLAAAEERMNEYLAGPTNLATLRELETEYRAIAAAAPEGSLAGATARERLDYISERRQTTEKFDQARNRIAEIEKMKSQSEKRYQERLTTYRETRTRTVKKAAAKEPTESTRFLRHGIGEIHKIIISGKQRPTYVLRKGMEERYLLVSERYDIGEYENKTIGIRGWDSIIEARPGEMATVVVTRLEIIE